MTHIPNFMPVLRVCAGVILRIAGGGRAAAGCGRGADGGAPVDSPGPFCAAVLVRAGEPGSVESERQRSWERRLPRMRESWERLCPARTGAKRPEESAGGTQAFPGRAVPRTPCPRAFARGRLGENPTAHLPIRPPGFRGLDGVCYPHTLRCRSAGRTAAGERCRAPRAGRARTTGSPRPGGPDGWGRPIRRAGGRYDRRGRA